MSGKQQRDALKMTEMIRALSLTLTLKQEPNLKERWKKTT